LGYPLINRKIFKALNSRYSFMLDFFPAWAHIEKFSSQNRGEVFKKQFGKMPL